LKKLEIKEENQGKFLAVVDELDIRTTEQKGTTNLHNGY
jgi:hypothetical protein